MIIPFCFITSPHFKNLFFSRRQIIVALKSAKRYLKSIQNHYKLHLIFLLTLHHLQWILQKSTTFHMMATWKFLYRYPLFSCIDMVQYTSNLSAVKVWNMGFDDAVNLLLIYEDYYCLFNPEVSFL